ncbi:ribonuclease H [Senna tora]|uniref:Ribonuclease H n=1 Tax=Senna tora TaxID=362788 RepID=A0A834X778_9FABA|nr:ribonuclease H [Senna tora]
MSGDEALSTLNPSMVPFWVRVYDLPFNLRTRNAAASIGTKLGEFLTWNTSDMGRWGKALRLRVTIDLTKPLKRGTLVRGRDGHLLKVFFRYEWLLDFCYVCGKLGHAIKDCNSDNHDDEQHLTYGPWLRASPTKVIETNLNKSGDGVRRMLFKPDAVVVGGDAAIVGGAKAVSDGVVVTDGDKPVADGGGSIYVKSDEVLQAQNCIIDEFTQLLDTFKWALGDVVDVENTKVGPKPINKSSFDKGKAIIISPMVSHLTVPGLRCSSGPSSPIDYPNSVEPAWTPRAIRDLSRLVQAVSPSILFLMETKTKTSAMEKVRLKLGFSSAFTVDCHGDGRRRSGLPHRSWRLTGVYGYPDDSDKPKTWQLLTTLFHSCSLPWKCLGDFNEILYNTEKKGGLLKNQNYLEAFRSVVDVCQFVDLGFKGYPFTWSNGRCEEDNVQERLDRVFATESWLLLFPYVAVEHLQRYTSDHCAISIYFDDISFPKPRVRKKIFRFEEVWVSDDCCENVIKGEWGSSESVLQRIRVISE